jgi:hypothetical protein
VMAGDVEDRDARLSPAALQMVDNFRSPFGGSLANSRVEVVSFLEVHVDDVIPADAAVEGNGAPIHLNSLKRRNLARRGHDIFGDFLKILQLVQETFNRIRIQLHRLDCSVKTARPLLRTGHGNSG